MDLYQYANNCTPTPSLTQQHSTDKKRLGLMLDLGRGRCVAAQILTLIRSIGCPRLRISLIIFFIHQYFHLCSDLSLKFSWYWGLFEYPDLYQNFSPFSRSSFACQWTGGWRTTIVRFSWHRGKTVNLTTAVINRGWGEGILYHVSGITGICLLYLVDTGVRYAKVPVILGAWSRIMKSQFWE